MQLERSAHHDETGGERSPSRTKTVPALHVPSPETPLLTLRLLEQSITATRNPFILPSNVHLNTSHHKQSAILESCAAPNEASAQEEAHQLGNLELERNNNNRGREEIWVLTWIGGAESTSTR